MNGKYCGEECAEGEKGYLHSWFKGWSTSDERSVDETVVGVAGSDRVMDGCLL